MRDFSAAKTVARLQSLLERSRTLRECGERMDSELKRVDAQIDAALDRVKSQLGTPSPTQVTRDSEQKPAGSDS